MDIDFAPAVDSGSSTNWLMSDIGQIGGQACLSAFHLQERFFRNAEMQA